MNKKLLATSALALLVSMGANAQRFTDKLDRGLIAVQTTNGVDLAFGETELIVAQGIRKLETYLHSIGMPIRLSEAGIDPSRIGEMAEKATRFGPAGNFKKLYAQDVENIYRLAL